MKKLESILDKLSNQLFDFIPLVLSVFMLFFIGEGANIYVLKKQNDKLQIDINHYTDELKESVKLTIANNIAAEKYRMSIKATNDRLKPFYYLFGTYKVGSGNLSLFLQDIKSDILSSNLSIDTHNMFNDLDGLINLVKSYPKLEKFVLAKAEMEFAQRSTMIYCGSSTCLTRYKTFVLAEIVRDQYHYYPNNYEVSSCHTSMKINGEIISDDYLWKPTRRGMHYFDIEYSELIGYRLQIKKFRIGLKVV